MSGERRRSSTGSVSDRGGEGFLSEGAIPFSSAAELAAARNAAVMDTADERTTAQNVVHGGDQRATARNVASIGQDGKGVYDLAKSFSSRYYRRKIEEIAEDVSKSYHKLKGRSRPVAVDFYCGTGTAAALFHLLRDPNIVVIGVDRDQTEEVIRSRLPKSVQDRFIFIRKDVRDVTVKVLQEALDQHWTQARLANLVHVHASPSCVSMSKADRFHIHRKADGLTPRSQLAEEDDESLSCCLDLMGLLMQISRSCLGTVENPVNAVFPYLECVRKLAASQSWRMLTASYCRCADAELDAGLWPQKDTFILAARVERGLQLPICNNDCGHLIPGLKRHRLVLCSGPRVLSEQYVIRDPLVKGMIPHGLFARCWASHCEWEKEASTPGGVSNRSLEESVKMRQDAALSVPLRHEVRCHGSARLHECLALTAAALQETSAEGEADADDEVSEEIDEEEPMEVCDEDIPVEGEPVDVSACIHPLADTFGKEGGAAGWTGWIAALETGKMFDLESLKPGELLFADEIAFDTFRVKGKKQSMLVVYDAKTAGMRVRAEIHKVEHGAKFREIALQEAWDKRAHKVTIGTDGCGSMKHLRDAALELGIDHFYLPPHSPRMNPVEQAVGRFKSTVTAVLQAACRTGSSINESFIQYAAEYVCYVHERVPHLRTKLGKAITPFEVNVGVEPRMDRLVPFGTPGYAFVPEEVRRQRGWGKSVRSEPVLMLGYLSMYSRVYKCLTAHGTIIHSEKVQWHLKAPKGVLLDREAAVGNKALLLPLSDQLFNRVGEPGDSADLSPAKSHSKEAIKTLLPAEPEFLLIRKNTLKSSVRAYIRARVDAINGCCVADVLGRWMEDSKGEMKRYKLSDLLYDIATGWIGLEISKVDISAGAVVDSSIAQIMVYTTKAILALEQREAHLQDSKQVMFAMKDLSWKKYLRSKEAPSITEAHEKELSALLNTRLLCDDGVERPVLEELGPDHPEYKTATSKNSRGEPRATKCRELLEYKRSNVWKARVCIQGFREDKEALDGADFNYSSHVVGLTAVRSALMRTLPVGHNAVQVDIATAFLQSNPFSPRDPARYLYLRDPVSGTVRYFRQWGVVYGACSSPVRFMDTLHPWIVSEGFVAGKNEPCVFYNAELDILVETYVDDCLAIGPIENVTAFMKRLAHRFKCKEPVELSEGSPIDHLGMNFIKTADGMYLSMESYIDTMMHNLELDPTTFRKVRTPISRPIDDDQPLDAEGMSFFRRGVGMIGWLAFTGRPDLKYCHSRISQHMARPTAGALAALHHALRYCYFTKTLGLHQKHGLGASVDEMRFYCDSDQSGNKEVQNKRRSQLGNISVLGSCPLSWGSKATAVQFQEEEQTASVTEAVGHITGGIPVCHQGITELHADMSSAAAEVYAASVALAEFLHLTFVLEEMGLGCVSPIKLEVDNSTAIAFAEGGKRSKMRHIDCRQKWVEALRDHALVKLVKVGTDDNLADLFTKILGPIKFEDLRDRIMWPCPSTSGVLFEADAGSATPDNLAAEAEKTESGKLGAAGIPAAETSIKSVPLMRTTANSVEQP